MATKSFQADFKFNQKASGKLVIAMESSRKVSRSINQPVKEVKNKDEANKLMASFLGK